MLSFKTAQRPGEAPKTVEIFCYNRTGAAVVEGDMASLNLDFVAATYTSIVSGASTSIWGNAIAVTTENAARVCLVAKEAIAVGGKGRWVISGVANVKQNGGNKGEYLVGTNAQVYATPYTLTELDGLTAPTGIIGMALEDSTGAQVKAAVFNGWAMFNLIGGGG